MSRRQKTSVADDLLEVVSRMPWWGGVVLAIGSYVVLHYLAVQPVATSSPPGQLGSMVTQTIWRTLATFGQYIVPFICVVGAGMSAFRRKERRQLVTDVAQSRAADALDGMSWQQFEKLVGEGFRLQGYRVAETGGGGADGGVDIVLTKGTEKFLVQCKQWRAFKVGVDVVRQLDGVMAARGATGGFVVTSGRFTDDAVAFATGRNIQLVDGPELHALIRSADGTGLEEPTRPADVGGSASRDVSGRDSTLAPACPTCAKPMVRRTAKRGANVGGEFWGCSSYPACRGTRAVAD